MSNQKRLNVGKLSVEIAVSIIILILGIRFWIYYVRSDGFSGMSPLLPLLSIITFASFLLMSCSFAAWVYQDCKRRNEDGILWATIVIFATPFIGLLLYFLRRPEMKVTCPVCKHSVSLSAKYCEECGSKLENTEESNEMKTKRPHHIRYITVGIIFMLLTITCLTTLIVSAASGKGYNSSVTSNEKVWNLGGISMNNNTHRNGVWKLSFKSASDGFVSEENMTISNANENILYADITCKTVPDNASLILYLVQEETVKSIDVTNLSETLQYPLHSFENGKIHVRLEINGVKNTESEIYIR